MHQEDVYHKPQVIVLIVFISFFIVLAVVAFVIIIINYYLKKCLRHASVNRRNSLDSEKTSDSELSSQRDLKSDKDALIYKKVATSQSARNSHSQKCIAGNDSNKSSSDLIESCSLLVKYVESGDKEDLRNSGTKQSSKHEVHEQLGETNCNSTYHSENDHSSYHSENELDACLDVSTSDRSNLVVKDTGSNEEHHDKNSRTKQSSKVNVHKELSEVQHEVLSKASEEHDNLSYADSTHGKSVKSD